MSNPLYGPAVKDRYIELQYADRDYATATRVVPISHNDAHVWVTVPWDVERQDPDHMHGGSGWTIVTAPADRDVYYSGVGALRMQGGVEGCSTHLMSYWARPLQPGETDGVDNIVEKREACEVFVGAAETHPAGTGTTYSNTHLILPFQGRLPAGLKLRLCADYWNAPTDSVAFKMCGGTATLDWGYGPVNAI